MPNTFQRELHLPVTTDEAFVWHERHGAINRLIPPWESVDVVRTGNGVRNGNVVELAQRFGPLKFKWIMKHHGYCDGRSFRDSQVSGPFVMPSPQYIPVCITVSHCSEHPRQSSVPYAHTAPLSSPLSHISLGD